MTSVHRAFRPLIFLLVALGLFLQLVSESAGDGPGQGFILDLEGAINPASAMYVKRGIEAASEKGAALVVIRLDTPGGLASSMRTIVKAELNASVPVAVYVAPSGASAASAGVMVTVAAHVAAMAPGTNIGAAHPVGAGGKDIDKTMSEKVVNDMAAYGRSIAEERGRSGEWVEKAIRESVSITAEEAVEKNVVDMIAVDLDDLLRQLDGKEVVVAGQKVTLRTVGLKKVYYKPGLRDKVLGTISDPNISYILMMIGLAGLYFELAHPGAIFPGVIGGISLILAFYSFQALPVNYAGLLLILLGVIFFILETQVPSFGMLSVGGLVAFVLGSMMLFEDIGVSLSLMMPTILLVGAFFVVVAGLAFRAQRARPSSGKEGLLGEKGFARDTIDPEGLVFVHGEHWKAQSEERIEPGERVEVVGMEGLVLKVRKIPNRSI